MVPIGIVTKDRVAYLDVTLRSLSATALPAGTQVTIFDDSSGQDATQRYYTTNKAVPVETHWPTGKVWRKTLGMGIISDDPITPQGIHGLINVRKLGTEPLGVVNASCRAACRLFDHNPDAPGIILLQDDIVFKENWYESMLSTVESASQFTELPMGLLAGLKINQKLRFEGDSPPAIRAGITAQCLYISREAYQALLPTYFGRHHKINKRFDDTLRRAVDGAGFYAGLRFPFVCQHIGIKSLVRPGKRWDQGTKGRVGYYVQPPYAMADEVKRFKGK